MRSHYRLDQVVLVRFTRINRLARRRFTLAPRGILHCLTTCSVAAAYDLNLFIRRVGALRLGLTIFSPFRVFIFLRRLLRLALAALLRHLLGKALRMHPTLLHREDPVRLRLVHSLLVAVAAVVGPARRRPAPRLCHQTLLLLQERARNSILARRPDQFDDTATHSPLSRQLHRIQNRLLLLFPLMVVQCARAHSPSLSRRALPHHSQCPILILTRSRAHLKQLPY